MRRRHLLALLILCFSFVIPVRADTEYSNGPTNGNTDAWTVNFGYIVSDTFYLSSGNITIAGASFAMWLFPGDSLTSAELSITSGRNLGTRYFDQTVTFTQGSCISNQYGFNVCQENTSFNGPSLAAGTYWLNLQNASVPSGDPIYWDENSGPSRASQSQSTIQPIAAGTIPSESFTILGNGTTCICGCSANSDCSADSTAPEPGSISLLAWGGVTIFGFLGALRRKLF